MSRGGAAPAGRYRIDFAQPHPVGVHYTLLVNLETTIQEATLVITDTTASFFRVEIFLADGSYVNTNFHFVVLM
jgi:hypothetical protein